MAEEDSGPFVKALLQDQPGKNLIAYREWLSMREFVQLFTKSTGLEAALLPEEKTDLSFLPAELQEELVDNMMYWKEFGYEARDDPTVIHPAQVGKSRTLDMWNVTDSSSSFNTLLSLRGSARILLSMIGQRYWALSRHQPTDK